jgi:hypothetical protein
MCAFVPCHDGGSHRQRQTEQIMNRQFGLSGHGMSSRVFCRLGKSI